MNNILSICIATKTTYIDIQCVLHCIVYMFDSIHTHYATILYSIHTKQGDDIYKASIINTYTNVQLVLIVDVCRNMRTRWRYKGWSS
jgi:hypothetical protein